MTGIVVRNIFAGHDGHDIIRGASFDAPNGLTMLLGPNGSGKSTLLRAISGMIPCRGSVLLDGRDILAMKVRPRAEMIAYLPQRQAWDTSLTVRDYVSLGAAVSGSLFSPPDRRALERADGVIDDMGISLLSGRGMNRISGGEARLAGIARAAAQGGRFMILDEPLAGLDYRHMHAVLNYIRLKCPASIVSIHDPALAWQYGDRVLLMDGGRIAATGAKGDEGNFERALQDVYGKNIEFTPVHGQLLPMWREAGCGKEQP